MEETLMEATRRLLRESPRSLPEIYAELAGNGSEITYYWLRKFSCGAIKDPSVNRVEEVYRHLSGKPLVETI